LSDFDKNSIIPVLCSKTCSYLRALYFNVVGIIFYFFWLLNLYTSVDYTSHEYRYHLTSFIEKKMGKEKMKEKFLLKERMESCGPDISVP